MARRIKGEGSVYQRHDHPTCPAKGPDDERPEHRCRGTWIAQHDMGWIAGKRVMKIRRAKTRGEARDKLNELRQKYPTGAAVDQRRRTVEQWMSEYLQLLADDGKTRPQTLHGYRSKNQLYITPLLGSLRLEQIDASHLDAMFRRMKMACPDPDERHRSGPCRKHQPSHGLSESTRRQTFMILRRAFKVAMRRRLVDRNPCDMIDPPGTATTDKGRLIVAQALDVLAVADAEDNAFNPARWYCALHLGMRQGEALGVRLCDVDLVEGLLYVRVTLQRDHDGKWVLDRPKSARSVRAIPMTPMAQARITVQLQQRRNEGAADTDVLFGGRLHWYTPPWDDADEWHALLEAAGVPPIELRAARSTTGSLLDEAGVPPRLVSEILGHTQVQFTQDTYVKGDLAGRRSAMAALGSYLSSSPTEDSSA